MVFAPTQCVVCRQWSAQVVCAACLGLYAAPRLRCPQCALPVSHALAGPCGHCMAKAPSFQAASCLADYGFPWSGLIAKLKYQQQPELANALMQPLAERMLAMQPQVAADCIVPIPLSATRLSERGYNQAWELARALARRMRLPAVPDALLRSVETPSQASSTRSQRLANLKGAFMPNPKRRAHLTGKHVLLVDDVFTTGATLDEAGQALLRGGAHLVSVAVIARTPEPGS